MFTHGALNSVVSYSISTISEPTPYKYYLTGSDTGW